MERVNKLAVAITIALGVSVASQANAEIALMSGGKGDALLFPVFNGSFENHFAILNDSGHWIQGHMRIRGAGWSGELLDFDVILSPHDVMEFRIADVDGDGFWEIDQSLDPKNFQYTGMLKNCQAENTGAQVQNCMDQSSLLIPPIGGSVTQELINYHRQWGYIEFISEGVLNGMNHAIMERLINPANAGKLANEGQRRSGNQLGTHLWSWTDADKARGGNDNGATDVQNVLGGTAFVTVPGTSHGLSYNAEAFTDFRTANNPHRIDNYLPNQAVIIHDENASNNAFGASPFGDYVYGFPFNAAGGTGDDRQDEARLRFSVTWGPTLADGDDYSPIVSEQGISRPDQGGQDDWDRTLTHANPAKGIDNVNSIAEVEEAVRLAGQHYTGFFLDNRPFDFACTGNCTSLTSLYYALFPTKYFYGESAALASTFSAYLTQSVSKLMGLQKNMQVEVWDTEERPACSPPVAETCDTSPCPPVDNNISEDCPFPLVYEGNLFSIANVKGVSNIANGIASSGADYSKGKFSIWPIASNDDPSQLTIGSHPSTLATWPLLLYTFELESANPSVDGAFVHHWKNMLR